ncbi:hypothetical protein AXF42_Ash014798 [Apostasia shenzhenica]|uniref:WW domain-containing protein n=1 Tax=Apostasia shenzhenica TaxID=1088818 RepID=A0A2H9ZWG1_9ASPA|nr:hypothetical protein AXF42_Ash014798 [Apostasia shenzhenica]
MTAPNIEAIAASLRNCSLGGRSGGPPPPQQGPGMAEAEAATERGRAAGEEADDWAAVTVELNSEVALPYPWEQCLDLRTGEVYYINWKDGTRTADDPRDAAIRRTSYCSLEEESSNDADNEEEEEEEEEDDDYGDVEDRSSSTGDRPEYENFYGATSSSGVSSIESPSHFRRSNAGEHVLVAAGCKSCFMYFMVPKLVYSCPKCGGSLLHLGRNGYF